MPAPQLTSHAQLCVQIPVQQENTNFNVQAMATYHAESFTRWAAKNRCEAKKGNQEEKEG